MDLEARLDELRQGAATAARHRAQQVGDTTRVVRRRARRVVRASSAATAVVLLGLAIALAAIGDPGGFRLVFAALVALPGLAAGATAAWAHRADRRDPQVRAARAERRGEPVPVEAMAADDRIPHAARHDWTRLLQARRLVQDLAADGWVAGTAMLDVDAEVLRLHRLLVAEGRTTSLGGAGAPALAAEVAELADLLVALADDAVGLRVHATTPDPGTGAPATLSGAREHLVALREAQQEVAEVERRAGG